jgi:hypothetical protein
VANVDQNRDRKGADSKRQSRTAALDLGFELDLLTSVFVFPETTPVHAGGSEKNRKIT